MLSPRPSRFYRATLKSWERPGDEAKSTVCIHFSKKKLTGSLLHVYMSSKCVLYCYAVNITKHLNTSVLLLLSVLKTHPCTNNTSCYLPDSLACVEQHRLHIQLLFTDKANKESHSSSHAPKTQAQMQGEQLPTKRVTALPMHQRQPHTYMQYINSTVGLGLLVYCYAVNITKHLNTSVLLSRSTASNRTHPRL